MSHVEREGKWEVGGEGRMLISFQVRLLEKFTRHVNERGTSNLSSCIKVFREILSFSRVERRQSWVTFTLGGKSHLKLVHTSTNQARLSVKFTCHI